MAPPAEPLVNWYQIVTPSIGITLVAILAFIASRFTKAAEPESTPAGQVAGGAIGAAFIDRSTADVATRMAEDIRMVREIAERWEDREQADERAELAELRRLAKARKE